MTTFKTTSDQILEVYKILGLMAENGLSAKFLDGASQLAREYEGAYDLLSLWRKEPDQRERDEIIADLQEEIDRLTEARSEPFQAAKINFDDLDENIKNILAFKSALKSLVEERGGISNLSRLSGIPQPSLSRFFNSASLPRNTTIYKILTAISDNNQTSNWKPPFTVESINALRASLGQISTRQ